jgi:hypothetical protein
MKAQAAKVVLVSALASLSLLAVAGQAAAVTPLPAWKILAATGPTNLPPTQSDVQKVTVEADGGLFTLSREAGEGKGTPVTQTGQLSLTKEAKVATIISGTFEAGARVAGSTPGSLLAETTIVAVNGSEVTLSSAPLVTGSKVVKVFTKRIGSVTGGPFREGDLLSGPGIAAGTEVTKVEGTTLTTTEPTTAAYESGQISLGITEATAPLPFDAEASEVQAALQALPVLGSGSVTVIGGPGGGAANPYFVEFGGPSFADQDVEQLTANGEALVGANHFVSVFTTVPGGAGTGQVGIFPANVGGVIASNSKGPIVVHIGPLPEGVVTSGPAKGEGWSCVTAAREATCEASEPVPARATAQRLGVPVRVEPSAAPRAEATVTISGGGAAQPASFQLPIVVSREDAKPGLAAFWAGAFEADGSLATQAGGHPNSALTYFVVNTVRSGGGRAVPAGSVKDVSVDVPAGFLGNPLVTQRCQQSLVVGGLEPGSNPNPSCEANTIVGRLAAASKLGTDEGTETSWPIFNNVPPFGAAAEFSTLLSAPIQSLVGSLRSEEDFGVRIFAPNAGSTLEKVFRVFATLEGAPEAAHGKSFLTLQSDCAEEAREQPEVKVKANTWQEPESYFFAEAPQPRITGCDKLELTAYDRKTGKGQVKFAFQPTSTQGSSPIGAEAHLQIDQSGLTDPNKLSTPPLKRSVVKLPAGLTVNPSSANGLEACSEAQVGYKGEGALPNPTRFNETPVSCPDGSKLGTVEATSPLLEEPLKGTIYLANQEENPFHALIGVYLVFESSRFGVTLKLPGKVEPDESTGQLTATFEYLPQAPVEDLTLHFRGGGPRSELATPEVCGKYTTRGEWEPWSAPESGPPAQTEDSFEVQEGCMESAGELYFEPSFEAGTTGTQAGAYSPLVIKVNRKDGEQELRKLEFSLPEGLTGKLAGIPYCSDAAIHAAEAKSGRAEQASSSCPAASRVGSVDTGAGVGSEPFHVSGSVYLAGPYEGAPLSSVVITPAVAGPFDLGDVVIRAPLFVDPETAKITAKSDPIPTILKGIPLKVRSVSIYLDRSDFTLNPSSCLAMKVTTSITGASGATATPNNRFQVGGCNQLKFKPKLKLTLTGSTKHAGHPALKAVLTYPKKGAYANVARAQVNLPHSEFIDQGNLNKTCTRPVLLAGNCPAKSIYGKAKAWTPLLDKPLEGPVYLVGGYGYKLPALVAELNGQIRVLLVGKVDSGPNHGIRNTFETVPDAPVEKFVLEMKGGPKYSLLENSENLCRRPQRAIASFTAQNGLVDNVKPLIGNQCKKGKKKNSRQHKKSGAKVKAANSGVGRVLGTLLPLW